VAAALVVVFDGPFTLLLLGKRDVEVEVEVAADRRRPWKPPTHPLLVLLQLRERRTRHRPKHDIMVRQVNDEAIEPVCDCRAGRTPRRVIGFELNLSLPIIGNTECIARVANKANISEN